MADWNHTDGECGAVPHLALALCIWYCPHRQAHQLRVTLHDDAGRTYRQDYKDFGPFDTFGDLVDEIGQWMMVWRRDLPTLVDRMLRERLG